MGKYDKIFKKHLKEDFLKMVADLLSIQFDKIEVQEKPTELTSKTLRSDFVFEVVREDREEIWHIEEQTDKDKDMFERMLLYVAFLYKKYKKPVYQVVLYVGDGKKPKSEMKSKDRIGFFEYSYKIISLSDIPYKRFFKSANTLPFAVLGKYDSQDSEKVLEEIFQTADKLLPTDVDKLNFIEDLAVLSKKRSLSADFIKSLSNLTFLFVLIKKLFIFEFHHPKKPLCLRQDTSKT